MNLQVKELESAMTSQETAEFVAKTINQDINYLSSIITRVDIESGGSKVASKERSKKHKIITLSAIMAEHLSLETLEQDIAAIRVLIRELLLGGSISD